jgi:membrane protease YdiL (CAAX protease family)
MIESSLNSPPSCPHCQGTISSTDSFCGHCGRELKSTAEEINEDVFSALRPTLLYYFVTLILLATYKFTKAFPIGLEGMLIVTVLDVLIVIAFWVNYYEDLKSLFTFSGLRVGLIALTILGAIGGSIVVSVVAKVINLSIHDDVFYDTYLFEDTSNPFLFATLLIAVQPAIFEEVTFRGFLFDNLKKVSNGKSAVYISGFVFGIMHLQIISLLWLVPIGLAFGFLRNKYNTLWYGMIGHFVYNFSITFFEFTGWF